MPHLPDLYPIECIAPLPEARQINATPRGVFRLYCLDVPDYVSIIYLLCLQKRIYVAPFYNVGNKCGAV